MRRWTSWAWGGNCDKPIADAESTRLGADAAGLDRAQAEETPTSDSAAQLNKLAHINQEAVLAMPLAMLWAFLEGLRESVENCFTFAQDTDIAVFPALNSA